MQKCINTGKEYTWCIWDTKLAASDVHDANGFIAQNYTIRMFEIPVLIPKQMLKTLESWRYALQLPNITPSVDFLPEQTTWLDFYHTYVDVNDLNNLCDSM